MSLVEQVDARLKALVSVEVIFVKVSTFSQWGLSTYVVISYIALKIL